MSSDSNKGKRPSKEGGGGLPPKNEVKFNFFFSSSPDEDISSIFFQNIPPGTIFKNSTHFESWVLGIITKTNTKIDINININNQSLKKTKRTRRGNYQTFSKISILLN